MSALAVDRGSGLRLPGRGRAAGAGRRGSELVSGTGLARAAALGLCLSATLASPPAAVAQASSPTPADVPSALAGLDEANARAWVEPLTAAVAPTLTAGFFTSGGRGDGFRIALRMNGGVLPSRHDRFAPVLPPTVTFGGETYHDPWILSGGTGTSPTVSGEGEGLLVSPRPGSDFEAALDAAGVDPGSRSLRLPGGLGTSRVPLPMVEASLALRGLGVQLVGRFSPTVEVSGDVGDVSTFGGGVLFAVSRFLPLGAVDVGLSATTQKLEAADWLSASASAFGVVVSRDLGSFRPYFHGSLASSSLEVAHEVHNPAGVPFLPGDGTPVRFHHEPDGGFRAGVGAVLALRALEVAAEYQAGGRDVVSVRLSLLRP